MGRPFRVLSGGLGDEQYHWRALVDLSTISTALIERPDLSPVEKLSRLAQVWRGGWSPNWPKLTHLVAWLTQGVLGRTYHALLFSNLLWLTILFVSVFRIGRRLESPLAGLVAACVVGAYPGIEGVGRAFGIDMPLVALSTLAVDLLLTTNGFTRASSSLAFGTALGVGILANPKLPMYVVGPFSMYLVRHVCRWIFRRKGYRQIALVTMALSLAAFIASIWGWQNVGRHPMFAGVPDAASDIRSGFPSFPWAVYYFATTFVDVSPILFLVFVWCLGRMIRKRRSRDGSLEIVSWIIVSFLILEALPIKHDRYAFPVHVPMALVTATSLAMLRGRRRAVALGGMLVFALAQSHDLSWGTRICPDMIADVNQAAAHWVTRHVTRREKIIWARRPIVPVSERIAEELASVVCSPGCGAQTPPIVFIGCPDLWPPFHAAQPGASLVLFDGPPLGDAARDEYEVIKGVDGPDVASRASAVSATSYGVLGDGPQAQEMDSAGKWIVVNTVYLSKRPGLKERFPSNDYQMVWSVTQTYSGSKVELWRRADD